MDLRSLLSSISHFPSQSLLAPLMFPERWWHGCGMFGEVKNPGHRETLEVEAERVQWNWIDSGFYPEKAKAAHSSTFAWKIPRTEEPGRLQSMGSLRVGHRWATSLSLFTFMHWRRKWQPTPVFLPGESQGQQSLGLPSMGSHRVGHDWSDLAATAAVGSYPRWHKQAAQMTESSVP